MVSIKNRAFTGVLIYVISSMLFFINPILQVTLISLICILEINKMLRRLGRVNHFLILFFAFMYICSAIFLYTKIYAKFGIVTLITIIVITMGSDSFSCILGTFFKRKNEGNSKNYICKIMAFRPLWVSPNKTVAGFIFAGIGGAFAFILFSAVFKIIAPIVLPLVRQYPHIKYPYIPMCFDVFSAFFLGLMGQVGDLIESAIKRQCGVKDSGTILADHGGFCDRYDSMYSTIIAAYYLMAVKRWI